jgi:nitrite reductase/ring-hydroxylating ferredoxin subunit
MERFVKVAKVNEVKRGKGKLVLVEGLSVAILTSDGAFYAIEGSCPFDGASLSDGLLNGSLLEYPLDKARFFAPTGECLSHLKGKDLRNYKIRVAKDEIYVDLGQSSASKKSEDDIGAGFRPDAIMSVDSL